MKADLGALSQFTVTEPATGYWRVLFSNPPINLLNSTSVIEIAALVKAIELETSLKVIVFVSDHPEFFMARYDLADRNPVAFAPTDDGVTLFIDSMIRMSRADPISIAAIGGRTRGGGSEFALSCDLRFASLEKALLGQPEVGVGMLPAGGAIERLPALVGSARALEIIASSDDYDAAIAERYGWINRAIPDNDLDRFVDDLARRLASFDSGALSAAKRLIRSQTPETPLAQYRDTLSSVRDLLTSEDFAGRRQAVAQHAQGVGFDFELRMGHHLNQSRYTA